MLLAAREEKTGGMGGGGGVKKIVYGENLRGNKPEKGDRNREADDEEKLK